VPVRALDRFMLATSTRRLVDAAHALSERYEAPVTTSSLILATLSAKATESSSTRVLATAILQATTLQARTPRELERRVDEWMLWYRSGRGSTTPAVVRAFESARELANSHGEDDIHAHDLLTALLTIPREEDAGVEDVLRWLGVPMVGLLELVQKGHPTAEPTPATPPPTRPLRHTLATLNTEQTKGTDLLDITRDVRSFATLIAAKNLQPPLSIGLFGNWGSGKSFFMEQMIAEVAQLARDATNAGFPTGFHTRIVQIRFNAWHYVEGNLWASLVEHIFRNLRFSEDEAKEETAKRTRYFVDQLDAAVQKRADAQAKIEEAEARTEVLTQRISAENKAANSAAAHFVETAKLAARDLVHLSDDDRAEVESAAKNLGLDRVAAEAGRTADAIDEFRQLGGRVQQSLRWLFRGPGWLTRSVFLALAVFSGIALVTLMRNIGTNPSWSATVYAVVAFLAGAGKLLRDAIIKLKPILAEVTRAREVVNAAYQQAETTKREQIEALKKQQEDAAAAIETARTQLADSEEKAREARLELARLGEDRKLVRFVDSRAASDDYRKLLGILAIVRSDFERLSNLLRDDATVGAASEHRIDRIVLYIDDLDRCPPRYVRDVLQAVHLLLAFPLFVVVVGVDARWISRSLEREYRDQLQPERARSHSGSVAGFGATAFDYLEKIFQVPFWIEPLTVDATRKLLEGIVEVRREVQPIPAQEDAPMPQHSDLRAGNELLANLDEELPSLTSSETPPQLGETRLNPAALLLEPFELASMEELAPLLGRSPRSVKRFTNIYRIIRGKKSETELLTFLGDEKNPGDYERVLLLLAIVTGAPMASTEVFARLTYAAPEQNLAVFIAKNHLDVPPRVPQQEWRRAFEAIHAFTIRHTDTTLAALIPHLREVTRYSFREAS
jgi:hypothetical protein